MTSSVDGLLTGAGLIALGPKSIEKSELSQINPSFCVLSQLHVLKLEHNTVGLSLITSKVTQANGAPSFRRIYTKNTLIRPQSMDATYGAAFIGLIGSAV